MENGNENAKKTLPRGGYVNQTAAGILMLTLYFLKCINFYSLINVGRFVLPLACLTALLPAVIYLGASLLRPRAANVILSVFYVIFSALMAVDLVYYNYMGKLPSVGLLTMIWQLGGVGGTVSELITVRQLIPLLDFPLWILWPFIKKYSKKVRELLPIWLSDRLSQKRRVLVNTSFTAVLGLVLAAFMLFGGFSSSFMETEMLTYHVNDISDFLNPKQLTNIDKSKYISPSQADNPYYGIAEGRNVFVIQVEALQNFCIGAVEQGVTVTPFMNELIKNDSFYFENYYYQVGAGNTSDAEFTVNNSLYANESQSSYERYTTGDFFGLPWLLKDGGYSRATAFHAYVENYWSRNKAYPSQGFDDYISLEDMDYAEGEKRAMGISDKAMFRNVVNTVKTYKEPFYSFVITLTSHHPFGIPLEDREVDPDNMSPNLYTLYVQSINYFDRALEGFFEDIKAAGLYENSVFVIYGDHYGIMNTEEEYREQVLAATGEKYDIRERFNVPLIIHVPGMDEAVSVDTVGGHVDVLPTLLCLLGMENNKSVMFGHNLLDPDYEGVVYEMTHLHIGSFITKDVFYMNSPGGINSSAYTENGPIEDLSPYADIVKKAEETIEDCKMLLDGNDVIIK